MSKNKILSKVPVTILTGFLGSGKTTLLNSILKSKEHGMKFAVIENEFGEVGVDEKVLSVSDEQEEIIEVMNGCICCTVRGDLVKTLNKLYERVQKFQGVIIETTGLADPAPVAQTFFVDDDIQAKYKLDGIITVVDAKHVLQHLHDEKPEGVENETVEQLAFADRIIMNKIDLVENESDLDKIESEIKSINGNAPIFRTKHSKVHPKHLLNIGSFDLSRTLEMDPEFLNTEQDHQHDLSVTSCSAKFEGELNVNKLQRWISEIIQTKSNDLFRYKGVLAVKGKTEKFVFQGVHMLFSGSFDEYGRKWKKEEKRECRFVFIGRSLDHKALIDGFMNCRAKEKLRFKVGDAVEANVGRGWTKGVIIAVWDDGNPYRIQLQDEEKTNVWGPVDEDSYVRKAQ